MLWIVVSCVCDEGYGCLHAFRLRFVTCRPDSFRVDLLRTNPTIVAPSTPRDSRSEAFSPMPLLSLLSIRPYSRTGALGAVLICLSSLACSKPDSGPPTDSAVESAEAPKVETPDSFATLANADGGPTIESANAYTREHPDAGDVDEAYEWLLAAALEQHSEEQAIAAADRCLGRDNVPAELILPARRVKSVGLAKSGKLDEAVSVFGVHLNTTDREDDGGALDFAISVAAQVSLADDHAAARAIFSRLKRAYSGNAQLRRICDTRIARLEMVGRKPPELSVSDLDGNPIDLSAFQGRPVLVDFWATHCRPCIEEFPAMKELYAEFHEQGFEVVGISFDEDPEAVSRFQEKWQLPWPLVVAPDAIDRLQESYGVVTIPAMFLIGPEGTISQVDLRGADLHAGVERLLDPSGE